MIGATGSMVAVPTREVAVKGDITHVGVATVPLPAEAVLARREQERARGGCG